MKRYTKQTLSDIKGPVTVVSGKKRRLTFIECNNDLNSMIDIGKVADLVLLMIDGSYGFEMVRFDKPIYMLHLLKTSDDRNNSSFSISYSLMGSQKLLVS